MNEEVEEIVLRSIEAHLQAQDYEETKVARWVDGINETCMLGLAELGKPFKYIVTCAIAQKNGAGMHVSNCAYWDSTCDGSVTVKWPGDKAREQNRTLYCVVSVFGLRY